MPGVFSQDAFRTERETRGREQRLYVGGRRFRQDLHGGRQQGSGIGQHAGAVEYVFHQLTGKANAARTLVQGCDVLHRGLDTDDEVILKVFADTVKRMLRFNPNPAEMVGIADAGQLQEMWRADGTGREDDFRIGVCKLGLAAAREFDAGRALTVEHEPVDHSVGYDLQIGPAHRRVQIGTGGAGAEAAAPCLLHPADMIAKTMRQVIEVSACSQPIC